MTVLFFSKIIFFQNFFTHHLQWDSLEIREKCCRPSIEQFSILFLLYRRLYKSPPLPNQYALYLLISVLSLEETLLYRYALRKKSKALTSYVCAWSKNTCNFSLNCLSGLVHPSIKKNNIYTHYWQLLKKI